MAYTSITRALTNANRRTVILGSIAAALGLSGVTYAIALSGGEKVRTLEADWVEANKEYMKFQKMNPIFGIGRGKY